MITDHHIGFASPEVPNRQTTILLEECNEGLDHVIHSFRLCISEQRMSRAECIPQRESAVIYPSIRLMHLLVRAIILSVYIAIDGRSNHGVIQSSIEVHTVVRISTNYLNVIQLVVPIGLRLNQILVEIIMRSLSVQVFNRTFHTHTRQGCCNHQLIAFLCIKHETGHFRCTHFFTLQLDFIVCDFHMLERTRETSRKIDLLTSCPSFRETVSTDVA